MIYRKITNLENTVVTIITPYTASRSEIMLRLTAMIEKQDYPNISWCTNDSDLTIGEKLNIMCASASDIILRMDSDDIYAPDWVSKSVDALIASGGNCTGLSKAYFQTPADRYIYKAQENAQPYVCGATMCFYKSLWQCNPFPHVSQGEDLIFQSQARVRPHEYIDGFTAIIHGANTCSHLALGAKEFTKLAP